MARQKIENSQAIATWQWHNFLCARAEPRRVVARINMDETSMPLLPAARHNGAMAVATGRRVRDVQRARQKASLAQRRGNATLIAFVADAPEVQRLLPQVLVVGKNSVPEYVWRVARGRSDKVFVVRRKSHWVTQDLLVTILSALGASLSPLRDTHHLLFCMDNCPSHGAAAVARACARARLHLFMLPSRMTSVMQPLDTHVFSKLKRNWYEKCQELLLNSEDEHGQVALVTRLQGMCDVISDVLAEAWPRAFTHCGLSASQSEVSQTLSAAVGLTSAPVVSTSLPTLAQLQSIYRRGAEIPIDAIFATVLSGTHSFASAERPRATGDSRAPSPVQPWSRRLRSASSAHGPGVTAATGSSDPPPPLPPPLAPPPECPDSGITQASPAALADSQEDTLPRAVPLGPRGRLARLASKTGQL